MNKQIEELALNIAQQVAPDGWLCGSDPVLEFAKSLLAELAKQSEPVGWFKYDKVSQCWHPQYEQYAATIGVEQDWKQLYLHPQADLVAEIERMKAENVDISVISQLHYDQNLSLRQQLSAAQADNEQLMNALEMLQGSWVEYGLPKTDRSFQISEAALDAHKTRNITE